MIDVLFGSNRYAISEELARIRSEFIQQFGEAGVENHAGEQLDLNELSSLFAGVSLFATNRLVIIRNLSANKVVAERFVDMIATIPDEVAVVLVEDTLDKRTTLYKILQKQAMLHELGELDDVALANWAANYAKAHDAKLAPSVARLLVSYIGADQLKAKNELDKLIAFNPEITAESVEMLVEKRPQDTVFQLLESALGGRSERALAILEALEGAHEDPFQIVGMLIWQAHILAVVASATAPESVVAKEAKINPFVVKKTKQLVAQLAGGKVDAIVDTVAELDVKLKSTRIDPWRALENTVASLK